jgi:hypothetical protein
MQSGTIAEAVLALFDFLEKGEGRDVIDIWCEVIIPRTRDSEEAQRLRANPRHDSFGPYYDWVDVEFDLGAGGDDALSTSSSSSSEHETNVAPAKLLAFFVDKDGDECAVVSSVHWSVNNETSLGNTRLIVNYRLQFHGNGYPLVLKIKLESIYRSVYVIERVEGGERTEPLPRRVLSRKDQNKYVISAILPRKFWAQEFYRWACEQPPFKDEVRQDDDASMTTEDDDALE